MLIIMASLVLGHSAAMAQQCLTGTEPYAGGCNGVCPADHVRSAVCSCQRGGVVTDCGRFGMTAAPTMTCSSGELWGGLCHKPCDAGWTRTASCTCALGWRVWTDCGRFGPIGGPSLVCPSKTDAFGGLCYGDKCPTGYRRSAACSCEAPLSVLTDCARFGPTYPPAPDAFLKRPDDRGLSCAQFCGNATGNLGQYGTCLGGKIASGGSTGSNVNCAQAPGPGQTLDCYCRAVPAPVLPAGARAKAGNNGSVSCGDYCRNKQADWGRYGECVTPGGAVSAGPLTGGAIGCDRTSPGSDVTCFCRGPGGPLPPVVPPTIVKNATGRVTCDRVCRNMGGDWGPYGRCVQGEVVSGEYKGWIVGCDEESGAGSVVGCRCEPRPHLITSRPTALGCCAQLVADDRAAGGITTLRSFGCTSPQQRVYRADLDTSQGSDDAKRRCEAGEATAEVQGVAMKPSACGPYYAFFAVDDTACPATADVPAVANDQDRQTRGFCVLCGTPPGYVTKTTSYRYGTKEEVRTALLNEHGVDEHCKIAAEEGECPVVCGDGYHDVIAEECDRGGDHPTCTADCRKKPGRDEPARPAPAAWLRSTVLEAGSGFVFGPPAITSSSTRDVWWNAAELIAGRGLVSLGAAELDQLRIPPTDAFTLTHVVPKVGEVIVVRTDAGYAAMRFTRVGNPDGDRTLAFQWSYPLDDRRPPPPPPGGCPRGCSGGPEAGCGLALVLVLILRPRRRHASLKRAHLAVLLIVSTGAIACGGAIKEIPELCGTASDGTNPEITLTDITRVVVRPPPPVIPAGQVASFEWSVWGHHNDALASRTPLICGAVFAPGFVPLGIGLATASTGVPGNDFRADGTIAISCTPGGHLKRMDGGGAWYGEGDATISVVVKKPISQMFIGAQVLGVGQSHYFHVKCGPPLPDAPAETLDLSGPGTCNAGGSGAEATWLVVAVLALRRRTRQRRPAGRQPS
ncbi:MAG: hypothetical protein IPH44_21675 [Myxococcales bacterium]|nr:hypothetical protein [Myxococcales bacterium]MBK7191969.1 hypothetical protein [Myxococcales bacterium]MBP6842194.1 hypothetical protein [Kofleriaceae bacterium]